MRKVGIMDCGSGNLESVSAAFNYFSAQTFIINTPGKLVDMTHIILPGVGAYCSAMKYLYDTKLDIDIKKSASRGIPILGLCLGMHLLMESGNEFGDTPGLGLVQGQAVRIQQSGNIKIPHIGWNEVRSNKGATLFEDIENSSSFYFNNSYCCTGVKKQNISATFDYGSSYIAAIEDKNIFGLQFHPEKSQMTGLRVLSSFLER